MPRPLPSYNWADVIWLLTVDFGGSFHNVSTEPVVVSRDDGTTVSYGGGLTDPTYRESLSRFTFSKDPLTVPIEAIFDELDIVKHRRKGFMLSNATCELSMVFRVGGAIQQTYEQRYKIASGLVSEPMFGDPNYPPGRIVFSINSMPYDDAGLFFKSNMRINSNSMANFVDAANPLSAESEDKVYPLVFGSPGYYADVNQTPTTIEATPAYAISRTNVSKDAREVLIAGHHVSASTVKIYPKDQTAVSSLSVTNGFDFYRNPIAYVDVSGQSSDFKKATEFWVSWDGGPGVKNAFATSGVVNGAGDLFMWALTKVNVPVDNGAWASVRDYLNGFRFAGYINDPETSVWGWITEIAGMIPTLTIRNGPDGIYPIVQDIRAIDEDCTKIVAGPDFFRVSGFQLEGEQASLVNTVTIEYAYKANTDESQIYAVIGEEDLTEPQRFSSIHSAASISRYGIKELAVTAPYVYNKATAQLIAQSIVQMKGQIPETITYSGSSFYSFLSLGDQVSLTDDDLYLTDQICTVCSKSWNGIGWDIKLLIEDDISRDSRYF
jgi:hypothetical protein